MNLPYRIEERTASVPDNTTKTFVEFHTITIKDAKGRTVATLGALEAFRRTASELARHGQSIEGELRFASSRATLNEYPVYVVYLGPRGAVRCDLA